MKETKLRKGGYSIQSVSYGLSLAGPKGLAEDSKNLLKFFNFLPKLGSPLRP